jgi:hypothetical protein
VKWDVLLPSCLEGVDGSGACVRDRAVDLMLGGTFGTSRKQSLHSRRCNVLAICFLSFLSSSGLLLLRPLNFEH